MSRRAAIATVVLVLSSTFAHVARSVAAPSREKVDAELWEFEEHGLSLQVPVGWRILKDNVTPSLVMAETSDESATLLVRAFLAVELRSFLEDFFDDNIPKKTTALGGWRCYDGKGDGSQYLLCLAPAQAHMTLMVGVEADTEFFEKYDVAALVKVVIGSAKGLRRAAPTPVSFEQASANGVSLMAPAGWSATLEPNRARFVDKDDMADFGVWVLPRGMNLIALFTDAVPNGQVKKKIMDGWTCAEGDHPNTGRHILACGRENKKHLMIVSFETDPDLFFRLDGRAIVIRAAQSAKGFEVPADP